MYALDKANRTKLGAACFALSVVLIPVHWAVAQAPPPPRAARNIEAEAESEVLLRGPVHEAFAQPYLADPNPGIVVSQEPPPRIPERPPAMMPAGSRVQWIPGYWGWDHERESFIWISGGWRKAPPDRRWVPGYWARVEAGYKWVPGFWIRADLNDVAYLPYPPESHERGPSGPPPSQIHFWVPGSWVYVEDNAEYRWRPGHWAQGHENWVWIPARYVWTPYGGIYVDGYWDYPIDERGMLFSPVYFRSPVYRLTQYHYTPNVVVNLSPILIHLFVNPDYCHYYFGDYYDDRYQRWGIRSWYSYYGERRRYDPLFVYYRWYYDRHGWDFNRRIGGWHRYYHRHEEHRPPRSLSAQQKFAEGRRDGRRPEGDAPLSLSLLGEPLERNISRWGERIQRLSEERRRTLTRRSEELRRIEDRRSRTERPATDQPKVEPQPEESRRRGIRAFERRLKLPDLPSVISPDDRRRGGERPSESERPRPETKQPKVSPQRPDGRPSARPPERRPGVQPPATPPGRPDVQVPQRPELPGKERGKKGPGKPQRDGAATPPTATPGEPKTLPIVPERPKKIPPLPEAPQDQATPKVILEKPEQPSQGKKPDKQPKEPEKPEKKPNQDQAKLKL